MVYKWIPTDLDILHSSYVNDISLTHQGDAHDYNVHALKNLLANTLDQVASSIASGPGDDPTEGIAYDNERRYFALFAKRIVDRFPDGWELVEGQEL